MGAVEKVGIMSESSLVVLKFRTVRQKTLRVVICRLSEH